MAWAACSSEEVGGLEAALRLISEVVLSSMVRYSEQSEEKASFSEVISSDEEVRRVTVRGVGGKNVGMPW